MVPVFDYIIVGGGTAGLLLASRLTEDPNNKVLVLDAGDDLLADPRVNSAFLWTQLQNSTADWNFTTPPANPVRLAGSVGYLKRSTGFGGPEQIVPQGRMLGGSGALNGMNFAVSSEHNIDAWESLGNAGWNWLSVSSALGEIVSVTEPAGTTQGDGPIRVTVPREGTNWLEVWKETIGHLGYPSNNTDPLSGNIVGAYSCPDAIDPETRQRSCSGNTIFQAVRSRPNLFVWTNVVVDQVVLKQAPDDDEKVIATGVHYTLTTDESSQPKTVKVTKEVILSAGVFNSPRILLQSGIGPESQLQSLNITPVVTSPGVGSNLQVHSVAVLVFQTTDDSSDPHFATMDALARGDTAALAAAMEALTVNNSGPFSKTNLNIFAQLPFQGAEDVLSEILSSPEYNLPEDEESEFAKAHKSYVHSALLNSTSAQYIAFPGWGSYVPETGLIGMLPPDPPMTYFTVGVILSHPLSTGSVRLSPDTSASGNENGKFKLEIDPNQLTHPLDLEILSRHVYFLQNVLSKTEPLAGHLSGPHPTRGGPQGKTMEDTRKWVRENSVLTAHFTVTGSMMDRDLGGVVDPELRVYGTKNLRVVDASVIPLVPRGDTMATVYAVAQRAAGVIMGGATGCHEGKGKGKGKGGGESKEEC